MNGWLVYFLNLLGMGAGAAETPATTSGTVCGTVTVTPRVGGVVTVTARVGGTVTVGGC